MCDSSKDETDRESHRVMIRVMNRSSISNDHKAPRSLTGMASSCQCGGPAEAFGTFNHRLGSMNVRNENNNATMQYWIGNLDDVTIKLLAAYVHWLGGGELCGPSHRCGRAC